jgi:hypothetical protein
MTTLRPFTHRSRSHIGCRRQRKRRKPPDLLEEEAIRRAIEESELLELDH